MKIKSQSVFHIKGLNQEKVLNELSKCVSIFEINRENKYETRFKCSFFQQKKVEKILKSNQIEYSVTAEGICSKMRNLLTAYGLLSAIILSVVLYFFQYQFVLQYSVIGTQTLDKTEIVEFLKDNFSKSKNAIDTEEVEIKLVDKFDEISFASCAIRGQTLVVNIKEKLMPEQMYGDFSALVAQKSGKISKINLISGTAVVEIGDIVKAGDVLVEPYTIDTSGQIRMVEAKAEIVAEVYNEGSVDHYESYIDVSRTGKKVEENVIKLFGLGIYSFKEDVNFAMYEVEYEEIDLSENLFLPLKMYKTIYYELEEKLIESNFDEVKDEFVEKAKQKALEKCSNCDTIIEEFYTLRHLSGVTIVNYCIISEEQIGGQ